MATVIATLGIMRNKFGKYKKTNGLKYLKRTDLFLCFVVVFEYNVDLKLNKLSWFAVHNKYIYFMQK